MQAIILAAGMGKRLKEYTKDNTKCMVEVNGRTLIDRMLSQLEKKSLSRIVIVVGYEGQKLIDYISTLDIKIPIIYIDNPIYDKTNNIYSLALAKDYLCQEDTLLFESDIIFEEKVIDMLLEDPRDTLALVDKYEAWMDGTCVKLNDQDDIVAFVPGKQFKYADRDEYYKTVNIYKFSQHFSVSHYVPFLEAYQSALGENEYYEQVLRVIAMLDDPQIKAKRLSGQIWYEIDDAQDLDIASSLFVEGEEKIDSYMSRYGGYWRYPKLLDFCYLVNPYYPPVKMMDELKASFDVLISQYPSGMRVNSLVAGRNFNVRPENIVVGNGAAELIKSLLESFSGNLGVIRPTFEEYGHRYSDEDIVAFMPANDNFSYTADDIMEFYKDKDIENLVLINPDNPSGNYIPKKDVLRLIEWTGIKNIRLVVDESFVDFSDEVDASIIEQGILDANKHLFVMKSISKSYGVPGIRLGILASGDRDTINYLKKDVAIWNINSFGEYFMQIFEKYRKDYVGALVKFREERADFIAKLSSISSLRLIDTQANFVMAEVKGASAKTLSYRLLTEYDILIKNLTSKIDHDGRQYIRLAIRNTQDNDRLVEALKSIL